MYRLYFQLFTKVRVSTVDQCFKKPFFEKNFMAPFYGWDSTVSMLWSHQEDTVYFLALSLQEYLVLILSNLEGSQAESALKPPSGFEPETLRLGIQHLNHQAMASAPDPKVLISNPNYMLGQDLGSNLNPRVWVTIGSYKIRAVINIE